MASRAGRPGVRRSLRPPPAAPVQGLCLGPMTDDLQLAAPVDMVPAVPCADQHSSEIFFVGALVGNEYPVPGGSGADRHGGNGRRAPADLRTGAENLRALKSADSATRPSCTVLAATTIGTSDPTFGGRSVITDHQEPLAQSCWMESADGIPLVGSLVGHGDAPLVHG